MNSDEWRYHLRSAQDQLRPKQSAEIFWKWRVRSGKPPTNSKPVLQLCNVVQADSEFFYAATISA
jgi:hypothetical protein